MPERPETTPFLKLVDHAGLLRRRLRRVTRPDLATPISLHQFIFVPAQPTPAQRVKLTSSNPTSAQTSKVSRSVAILHVMCMCRAFRPSS